MAQTQEELEAENDRLRKELAEARTALRRAKDPTPVKRPSFKRLIALVKDACMEISKIASGWELRFGKLKRRFRFLREMWEIFTEDWLLSEVFPPEPPVMARPRRPFRHPVLAAAATGVNYEPSSSFSSG